MPKQLRMTFHRADYSGRGCLEYSWVPEGKRRLIVLNRGVQQATQVDSVPESLKPTHVQVYVLNNNDRESTEMWQFPAGPPSIHPVGAAIVDVPRLLEAVGTVVYSDGSKRSDRRQLEDRGRPCPTRGDDGP